MLNEAIIKALEDKGFKRWTKGTMDRMYINASTLGLECTYYNTGNIKSAEFRGERLSNADGRRYKAAKTYIDITTGAVHSDIQALKDAVQEILDVMNDEEQED